MDYLPTFEPSEEDLYQEAIRQPLAKKVDEAVGLLRVLGEGGVVCFSGGKDSIVLKDIARRAGITCSVVYSVTTIDPPELIYYIREHHADVTWRRQPMHMLQYMVDSGKGLPSRWCRWCCEKYKENTGNGATKIIGVRAEESNRRKRLWKQVNANKREKGGIILAPLVYWTDRDIWRYIRENHLPYCCLYDESFTRIGCIGCPLAGSKKMKEGFARFPGFAAMWRRYAIKFYNRWHGVPTKYGKPRFFEHFGSGEALFDAWLNGGGACLNETTEAQALELFGELPCDADCQSRFANY